MDLPLFNGRPVTIAADVLATSDYIPLRRSSELGDARHAIITPAELGAAISPYVSAGGTYTAGTGLTLSGSIFAIDSTVVVTSATQVLTNKTLTSPIVNVGSDVDGDLYYRSGGNFVRLPIGSSTNVLTVSGGVPTWAVGTGTLYTAGSGLLLTGTTFMTDATVVTLAGIQTLTNKTLSSPIINLGSDATGDIYYRNGSGLHTRLPIGTNAYSLTVSGGVPVWAPPELPTQSDGILTSTGGSLSWQAAAAGPTIGLLTAISAGNYLV